jgi:hypothetical protein
MDLTQDTIHARRKLGVDFIKTVNLEIYKKFSHGLKMNLRMYQDINNDALQNYDDYGLITGSTKVGKIYDESCNYESKIGVNYDEVDYYKFSLEFYMPQHYFSIGANAYSFSIPRNPNLLYSLDSNQVDTGSKAPRMLKIQEFYPIIPPKALYNMEEEKLFGEQKMYKYVLKPELMHKLSSSPPNVTVFITDVPDVLIKRNSEVMTELEQKKEELEQSQQQLKKREAELEQELLDIVQEIGQTQQLLDIEQLQEKKKGLEQQLKEIPQEGNSLENELKKIGEQITLLNAVKTYLQGNVSYYLGECIEKGLWIRAKEKYFYTIFSNSILQGGSLKSKKKSSIRMKKRISKKKINKTSKNLRKKKNKKYISKRRGI